MSTIVHALFSTSIDDRVVKDKTDTTTEAKYAHILSLQGINSQALGLCYFSIQSFFLHPIP